MKIRKAEQKLVSFFDQGHDFQKVQEQMNDGWFISSLTTNGFSYVGILERKIADLEEGTVYIPPRKKFKFSL